MIDHPHAAAAIAAVCEAAELTRLVQRQMVTAALTKGDKSPVTVADFAAQAAVAFRLLEHDPRSRLVGEESASLLREDSGAESLARVGDFVRSVVPDLTDSDVCELIDHGQAEPVGAYWTLDPVDGTKGFLRKEQYAVALALVVNGTVELGVLGCPGLVDGISPDVAGPGTVMVAARGQGTWMRPLGGKSAEWQRVSASTVENPAQARLFRSVESGHTNTDGIAQFADRLGIGGESLAMDSQAKYAVLAAGGGEILLRLLSPDRPSYREKIWDQAAGGIVIEEAGGRVTDLDGQRLHYGHGRSLERNRGVLVTNGRLHDRALAMLRELRL